MRYLGSIAVRDRVLDFSIENNTLAVLVERAHSGADGVRPLAIDWYDVARWRLLRRRGFRLLRTVVQQP